MVRRYSVQMLRLTLARLNKLRCHAHSYFPANQITWSGFLIEILYLMTNCADPDQLASSEANWSGSPLFAKTEHVVFSKRMVNTVHAFKEILNLWRSISYRIECLQQAKTQISLHIHAVCIISFHRAFAGSQGSIVSLGGQQTLIRLCTCTGWSLDAHAVL